ncbi:MAG: S8 family serine peptidase, partial [Clostridia bacterium]|nr:S8 family serine peptidase [Clostridia bacterium]
MEYAYLNGASVSNLSLGGLCDENESHYFMAEIVDSSYDNGTAVIVAAGNESQDAGNCCPANIERLCTVASIGTSHSLSYFSNYGAVVDIAAPGENISSSVPGGGYETADGTSMACPHVAAVAAMIKSANPEMSADGVVSAIKGAASPISATNAGAGMAHLDANLFTLNPAANAEGGTYHFASAGSYPWTVDGNSVVSGNAGVNNSTSTMKTELTLGPGQTITFDYKVSSEQGKDYFRVKANGSVIFQTSGETGWQTETVTIPGSGSVQIAFEYYKNASGSSGSDKAWVKNVKVSRSLTSAANLTGGTVPFASSGAYPWAANDAENAAMSGNAGVNSSESVMTAQATLSKGMLIRFKYKVDSASGDQFRFKLDGRAVLTSGATDGYVDFEYVVPSSGSHTFEFVYSKNASGSSGADAAFVKAFAFYYSFDAAVNADGGNLPFTNDAADYPWFAMHDYVCSSNFGMGDTSSYFTLTLPMNAGETLSFRYKVSSVETFDYFKFYADNEQLLNVSGEISWTSYTFTATQSKTYTFKWAFDKDPWDFASWVGCDDAAYVDDVAYSGVYGAADGDVNNDGVVDSLDALLVLRYALGLIDETQLDLSRADVTGDGVVDSSDALMILRMATGLI